jgi:SAM-dependent methyltransferase
MPLLSTLAHRVRESEDIDDPGLETDRLYGALGGISTINLVSASSWIVWRPIARLARQLGRDRLRVLDIATGAGDIPRALVRRSQRKGLRLEIHGVDISERALDYARQHSPAGAGLQFSRLDALAEPLPPGYDVIVSSLFLHHLDDEPAVTLLRKMAAATNYLVLVNDLRRGWGGLVLACLAGRLLTRSPVVRVDAVRSVRAAFTLAEARHTAAEAGLEGAVVSRRWPCRFLLHWQKPPAP